MGGNPTLEIDKREIPHFLYKRGHLPIVLGRKKERETMGLPHQRVGGSKALN